MKTTQQFLSILLSVSLIFAPLMLDGCKGSEKAPANANGQVAPQSGQVQQVQQAQQAPATTTATPTPDELYQLVAPIALFPDNLVAQVLAGSTYPDQITAANTWLQQNSSLKGDPLMQAVDQQSWDVSVKGLTQFPDVLNQMASNLSWTSALGDAYYNIPQDVMNAVQVMRQRAQQAGNLKSTPQQAVTDQDSTISIDPTNADTVYVPEYDPWLVYGDAIPAWPGWYPYPGIWFGGPYLSFGLGFGVGFLGGFGWGWHHWGFDWHNHAVLYNRSPYFSRSTTFYNRGNFYRGAGGARTEPGPARGGVFNGGERARPFGDDHAAARGFSPSRGPSPGASGMRSGAFSGFNHGGEVRGFSARGSASFGGGAERGGGERGGGGRR
jgi:hypothetical protein